MKNKSAFLITLLILSCGNKKDKEEIEIIERIPYHKEIIKVDISTASKIVFSSELISNGKLTAVKKASILFNGSELIKKIFVKNGDKVSKNKLLAEQDKEDRSVKLSRANIAFEKSLIDLEDKLLGYGFQIADSTNIPVNILKACKIKSGYINAVYDLKQARKNYALVSIRAPFSGIIANLEAIPDNVPSAYKNTLCTLIDNSKMKVVFTILESELKFVKKGQKINVFPFSDPDTQYQGQVAEINPLIDENGMVKIGAIINNLTGSLFDGMGVKVLVKNEEKNQLVIPKSAVLLRQNKKVLFTYKDGEALWNYVETGKENSSEVVILKGIQEGDQVIVSGNLNLADRTKVSIEAQK